MCKDRFRASSATSELSHFANESILGSVRGDPALLMAHASHLKYLEGVAVMMLYLECLLEQLALREIVYIG